MGDMMRKVMLGLGLVAAVLALAVPAGAQTREFVIQTEGVARGEEGSVLQLVSQPVDADLVGATCEVDGRTENNESVHPDNDLIIETGGTTAEVPDAEAEANSISEGVGTITLGETVTVSIRFGPDEVTSGGLFLDFVCQAAAPEEAPETGAGGTAGADDTTPWVAIGVVGAAAAGGAVLLGRRRLSGQG
jgi:hypothetical protein